MMVAVPYCRLSKVGRGSTGTGVGKEGDIESKTEDSIDVVHALALRMHHADSRASGVRHIRSE